MTGKPVIDSETTEIMTATSELVGPISGGGVMDRPPYEVYILAAFDRCRSLLGAIHLLLLNGFSHEAVMLGRPLFTDSLMLAELAAVDEKRRAELFVGWAMAGIADFEGIYLKARSRGDDVSPELGNIAKDRTGVEEFARRRGVSTKAWRPDRHAEALADKHGRGDEYMALHITHQFVHGSTKAISQRYSTTDEDVAAVGGPHAQLVSWANDAGLFAAYSTLHAARAACKIFGWDEPPQLDALVKRIDAILVPADAEQQD